MRHGKINSQIPSSFIGEMEDYIKKIRPKTSNKVFFQPRESRSQSYIFENRNKPKENIVKSSQNSYSNGQKVRHKKWGKGVVTQINESNGDQLVTVLFDEGGLKTLISSLAPMEVID